MNGPNNVDAILKELEDKENAYNNNIKVEKNTVNVENIF